MKKILLLSLFLSLTNANATLIVHEWGTFTSLVGSNGVQQDGMFHEDEELPSFVHNFGDKNQAPQLTFSLFGHEPAPIPTPGPTPPPRRGCGHTKVACEFLENQVITQKMETPVLYFHSDSPLNASVEVGFPKGIISQTFPAPLVSLPLAIPGTQLINGSALFNVNILTQTALVPPAVDKNNIYSHARKVVANTIESHGEVEKFIFYRGIGKFDTKLGITSNKGDVFVKNISKNYMPQVFLVDNSESGGAILSLGDFKKGAKLKITDEEILSLKNHHLNFEEFSQKAKSLLVKSLVSEGLYNDEALAMVNTWENGYFHTPGLRVLYILNRNEVEEILPMKITPIPAKLNRVFVGRIEVLRDVEENKILSDIIREKESFNVLSLGRFAPSIIHRIHGLAQERGVLNKKLQNVFDQINKIISLNL